MLDDGCGSVWSSGTVLPAAGPGRVRHRRLRLLQRRAAGRVGHRPAHHRRAPGVALPAAAPGPRMRLGLRRHRQRRGRRRGQRHCSWAWGPRTAPTTRSTPPPARCGGRPTSSSAGSRAGSSPPPPTTGTASTAPPPSATSAASRATAKQSCCDPSNPRDTAVAGALRRTPSTRPTGAVVVAGGPGRLVRAHHRGRRHDLQRPGPVGRRRPGARRRRPGRSSSRSSCPRPTGRGSPRWATPWCSGSATPTTPRTPASRSSPRAAPPRWCRRGS